MSGQDRLLELGFLSAGTGEKLLPRMRVLLCVPSLWDKELLGGHRRERQRGHSARLSYKRLNTQKYAVKHRRRLGFAKGPL